MRVFLKLDGTPDRDGYANVDAARGNLDGVVEAGEAAEFVALGVLDRMRPDDQGKALRHWASRLAPGGTLTVSCTDLYEVCRATVAGHLDEAAAVKLLYGGGRERRAVLFSERTLQGCLRGAGLEVVTRRTDGVECVITCRRPL